MSEKLDVKEVLRAQAWERAKKEMRSILDTWPEDDPKYEYFQSALFQAILIIENAL